MKKGFVEIFFTAAVTIFILFLVFAFLPVILGLVSGTSKIDSNPNSSAFQQLVPAIFIVTFVFGAYLYFKGVF